MYTNEIKYKNDDLTITGYPASNYMFFKCSPEDASLILSKIKEAKSKPSYYDFMNDEERQAEAEKYANINKRDAVIKELKIEGYTEIGRFEDIMLYVIDVNHDGLFIFKYVSDTLPNRHGSTQVNIKLIFE